MTHRFTPDQHTQNGAILRYMQEQGSITTGEAAFHLGVLCLHKRIDELRKDGYMIESGLVPFENRYGHAGQQARHTLLAGEYKQAELIEAFAGVAL
jgi:hypothetical protein